MTSSLHGPYGLGYTRATMVFWCDYFHFNDGYGFYGLCFTLGWKVFLPLSLSGLFLTASVLVRFN